jgi:hypothetical protein
MARSITYREALNEALAQEMEWSGQDRCRPPSRRPSPGRVDSGIARGELGQLRSHRNEPAVRPETIRRWANRTISAIGMEMITTAASIRL